MVTRRQAREASERARKRVRRGPGRARRTSNSGPRAERAVRRTRTDVSPTAVARSWVRHWVVISPAWPVDGTLVARGGRTAVTLLVSDDFAVPFVGDRRGPEGTASEPPAPEDVGSDQRAEAVTEEGE
jgi:hypothetical protein